MDDNYLVRAWRINKRRCASYLPRANNAWQPAQVDDKMVEPFYLFSRAGTRLRTRCRPAGAEFPMHQTMLANPG